MTEVTRILEQIDAGEAAAAHELLPLVYEELRRVAGRLMHDERPGHTLDPTALVHEAWLRLVGDSPQQWNSRGHFFAAAAEAMRRILVEAARRRQSLRRGGGRRRLDLLEGDAPVEASLEQFVDLDDALSQLAGHDERAAELVKLRVFGGVTIDEAAGMLGISPRTAKRLWSYARAWLRREMDRAG